QRKRLTGALGNHLGDCQTKDEIRKVLLAARDDRLRNVVFLDDDVVILVELQIGVSAVRQVREESACELGDLWTEVLVQIGPDVRVGVIQLLLQPKIDRENAQ